MRVGLLTGGGDAPGLNGIIESVTRTLIKDGHEVFGIQDGFEGVFQQRVIPLTLKDVEGIHSLAGTVLGTSNKCGTKGREDEFISKYKALKLDALVAAGGDGTFQGLCPFTKEINLIGVPKTIDNDLSGTDITFGYDTACSVVAEAVDDLRLTAKAHNRIIIVEAMGRTSGWVALGGAMASYADAILIPERKFTLDGLAAFLIKQKDQGRRGLIIVVSEGASPQGEKAFVQFEVENSPQRERYGGIAHYLAGRLEKMVQLETRAVVLGHLQRGRAPTTTDRFLTLAMGITVGTLIKKQKWQMAASYIDGKVKAVPIKKFMGEPRLVPHDHRWVHMAQELGIYI